MAASTFWRRLIARDPYMVGRRVKLYRGFPGATFSLGTLETELFLVDRVIGPDENGQVQIVLADILQLAEKTMLPLPTDGKLVKAVEDSAFTGFVVGATSTTVTLSDKASAIDGAYDGYEVLVIAGVGTGAGNRQKIASYVGATRTATLVGAWVVQPDPGSEVEVTPLQMTLAPGKGALYNDPAATLKAEYVRVGDEVIRYTAKSGDVLSWADGSYRAQFDTAREGHDEGDKVQQCTVFSDAAAVDVVHALLTAASIDDSLIDLAGLTTEGDTWLKRARITAVLSAPEKISAHLAALCTDLDLMLWWDPPAQKIKGKVNAPDIAGAAKTFSDANLVYGGTRLERMESERVTRVAIDFALRNATANRSEQKNYLWGVVRADSDAESPNAYGPAGIRVNLTRSYWLSQNNAVHAEAVAARRLNWLRDAPTKMHIRLDPDDTVNLADLVDITTRRVVDQFGAPVQVRYRVVKVDQQLSQREVDLVSTKFAGKRWAWIAPNGQPDYLSASVAQRTYAYVCPNTHVFSNGDAPYLII